MSHLTISYQYDGTPDFVLDDFGWLGIEVVTEVRFGKGGYWVQWQDVKEFGETLGAFPIAADKPLKAEWGYSENGIYELVLGITIEPAKACGTLRTLIQIADQYNPNDRVQTSFETSYADLAAFKTEVAKLMAGEVEQAYLRGS